MSDHEHDYRQQSTCLSGHGHVWACVNDGCPAPSIRALQQPEGKPVRSWWDHIEDQSLTKPRPCPFCGSAHVVVVHGNGIGRMVECEACSACGPDPEDYDEQQAITAWNERSGL